MSGIHAGVLSGTAQGPILLSTSSGSAVGTTALVINIPVGVLSGHLLVAVMCSSVNSNQTWGGDTGWTERLDQNAPANIRVATLIAGSAEPSSYTFTISAGGNLQGFILAFANASYDNVGVCGTSTLSNPVNAGSTTFSVSGLLLGFFAQTVASGTFSAPTGMNLVIADTNLTSPSATVFIENGVSGATGIRTSTSSASGNSSACLIGLV